MRSQLVIVLLVGLAASAYALDLSHAHKRSIETEATARGIFSNFYAQVIYPPMNHVATNMALLAAQMLAGFSQTGIPLPSQGRILHPSAVQVQGGLDGLWQNTVRPLLKNVLSKYSVVIAQLFSTISTGRNDLTEVEMRGFFDTLADGLLSSLQLVWSNVLQKPTEQALSTAALLGAQVLAGAGVNGVSLDSLFGKRDLTEAEMRGFWSDFGNTMLAVFQKPLEDALSTTALLGAQVLAGAGVNGVSLDSLFGKRDMTEAEMRGFFDDLLSTLLAVVQKPLEDALSTTALLGAQVLAGAGVNGVSLDSLFGKRDMTEAEMRGFFDDLLNTLLAVVQKPVEQALSTAALLGAQVLAGAGVNGVSLDSLFGKRDMTEAEMRGFFDDLLSTLLAVVQKPLEDALSTTALLGAQVLAGAGVNGVSLDSLFGKRDLTEAEMRGFWEDFANSLLAVVQKPVEQALSTAALLGAQVLAGAGVNGVSLDSLFGKRDLSEAEMRGFFDALGDAFTSVFANVLQKPLENALSTAALLGAQMLAGAGVNGVSLDSLFGKRSAEARGPVIDGLLSHATGLYHQEVKPMMETAINNAMLSLAGVLANFSSNLGRR
ncbi:unnamed protein product [Adineta steineri]|uniref:Uncharacterized protein n=1 Tax=Adineta steineri TaxID=433720 RepID=A0A814WMC7_9BILA|nr:unnamed protein product [Adineta steineri]CAF4016739.1 unnamed protein product [Adineta steineri]